VSVVRGAATLESAQIESGDVFALAPAAPLAFADAKLTSRDGAVIAMKSNGLVLLRGAFELECTGRTAIEAGPARATTAGSARASFELALPNDAQLASAPFDAALAEKLESAQSGPTSLRMYVASGELSLRHRGGTERLPAGFKRELWRVVPTVDSDEDANKTVRSWLVELGLPASEASMWDEMNTYFATHPTRWAMLREVIAEQVERDAVNPAAFHEVVRFGPRPSDRRRLAVRPRAVAPLSRGLPRRRDRDAGRARAVRVRARGRGHAGGRRARAARDDVRRVARAARRQGCARGVAPLARGIEARARRRRSRAPRVRGLRAGAARRRNGLEAHDRGTRPAIESEIRAGRLYVAAQCVGVLQLLARTLAEHGEMPLSRFLALPRGGWPDMDAQALRSALDELARSK
jgi:hypothetical protein